MKATDPYEFPYPECDPPRVKDSSDIIQMRNLARAIDTKVGELFTQADDEFISPDACKVARTAALSFAKYTQITFNTTQFDNSPGAVMGGTNGITIRQPGYYFVAGYMNTSLSADKVKVRVEIDGLGDVLNEGIGIGTGSGCHMTGTIILPLNTGQVLRMVLDVSPASATVNGATLACVRITGT